MTDKAVVRMARSDDEARIVSFLDAHWRRQHVFVTNPELLRWQHQFPGAEGEHLTCMMALRQDVGGEELVGLIGFIPFRRYDPAANWSETALAIWKVRDDAGLPGVGLTLHNAVMQLLKPDLVCSIGISQIVRPIYKALGYTLSELRHAALFPVGAGDVRVAKGAPEAAFRASIPDREVALENFDAGPTTDGSMAESINALGAAGAPRKSAEYIRQRFLAHPCYDYTVKVVTVAGAARAVLVWRRVETPLGAILRIVDIIGDADVLARCGETLRAEVTAAGAEYIDLMHYGVAPEALRSAGFVSAGEDAGLVLPNYFSPFVHSNVRIEIAFKFGGALAGRKVRLFRADSDQDRPNDSASAAPRVVRHA